jgi:hypothetical protein
MNLYYLSNGLILGTEEADEGKAEIHFDPKRTLIVGISMQGSRANVSLGKASESVGKPTVLAVQRSALIMQTDIGDTNLVQQMKAALSGLVIVPGNGRQN